MKRTIACCLALILLLTTALLLLSCSKEEAQNENAPSYDEAKLGSYLSLDGYTGLTVSLHANETKGEAVWKEVLSRASILTYPEDAVAYYLAQKKETYQYYAEKNGWSYEEALAFFGVTNDTIQAEAKEMVKGDLVYRFIVKDAGIEVTEQEKATLLDRYVKKYAEDYGHTEEYIREHMTELIYDSMLYDKTMEYLIVNNSFVIEESTLQNT